MLILRQSKLQLVVCPLRSPCLQTFWRTYCKHTWPDSLFAQCFFSHTHVCEHMRFDPGEPNPPWTAETFLLTAEQKSGGSGSKRCSTVTRKVPNDRQRTHISMFCQKCVWQWLEPESSACRQLRASMRSTDLRSARWPSRSTQTVSRLWPPVMELLASGSRTSTTTGTCRKRMHLLCNLIAPAPLSTPLFVSSCRKWCKDTFDYLLSHLSSPESVKMGIFLQSGYNLLTEPGPVSNA